MTNCDVILLACKFNSWCVPPFLKLHKKFWHNNIKLVAEKDYSNGECDFIQLPPSLIVNGDCPRNKFSDSLIYALNKTPNKNAIVLLADYFINEQVNLELLSKSVNYIDNNINVLRIDIGGQGIIKGEVCPSSTQPIANYDWLFECTNSRDCFFPISLCPGIWNKSHWLNLLEIGWDPWQTEILSYRKYMAAPHLHLKSLWATPSVNYYNIMRGRDDITIDGTYLTDVIVHHEIKELIPQRFRP